MSGRHLERHAGLELRRASAGPYGRDPVHTGDVEGQRTWKILGKGGQRAQSQRGSAKTPKLRGRWKKWCQGREFQ